MFRIALVIFLFSSCAEPALQGEQEPRSLEEIDEDPENTSLFHNQKDKLFQFTPKNERSKDPKVDALLKTVEKAIKQKDLNLLFSVMDEDIISSHGGGVVGYDGIKETWERDYQELWDKLDWIVKMGGFFVKDSLFRLPYCDDFERFPSIPDAIGYPYAYGMCVSKKTKLYPSPKCETNNSVDIGYTFALIDLEFGFNGEKDGVFKINPTDTGIHGYVKATDFYRSSDYSLFLEKNKQGTWKITAFAPWD